MARSIENGKRVKIGECLEVLREEEEELRSAWAAKRDERVRAEEVARRFGDAEAERHSLSMRARTYHWILISGEAAPDSFDVEAMWNTGEILIPGAHHIAPGVPFVLYERVQTPAGEAKVFTPDRVDPFAVLKGLSSARSESTPVTRVIVDGLKATIGDVKRRTAEIEAAKLVGKLT